jgi:phosphatidylglycerophosphate synthase
MSMSLAFFRYFLPHGDFNIGYILIFCLVGLGLVYGIDYVYQLIKKSRKK